MKSTPVRKLVRQDAQVVAGNVLINKQDEKLILACKPGFKFPNDRHTIECGSWAEAKRLLVQLEPVETK